MSILVLGTKTTYLRLLARLGDRVGLAVTLDDSDDTRSRLSAIVEHSTITNVPLTIAENPQRAYSLITKYKPDVVFVAGWYRIIPEEVLQAVEHGFVGVHYSALPQYRGSAPAVWAMINGDAEIGYSLFRLSPGMDEGPIAAQGKVPVSKHDTIATVLDKLDEASLDAFVALADTIGLGKHVFEPQSEDGISYSGARVPDDGRIDWSAPAAAIERFVRAQTRPYPGAFSDMDGRRVKVWAATASDLPHFGSPGQVVRMRGTSPVVACGHGTGLILEELESDGPLRFSLLRSRFGVIR